MSSSSSSSSSKPPSPDSDVPGHMVRLSSADREVSLHVSDAEDGLSSIAPNARRFVARMPVIAARSPEPSAPARPAAVPRVRPHVIEDDDTDEQHRASAPVPPPPAPLPQSAGVVSANPPSRVHPAPPAGGAAPVASAPAAAQPLPPPRAAPAASRVVRAVVQNAPVAPPESIHGVVCARALVVNYDQMLAAVSPRARQYVINLRTASNIIGAAAQLRVLLKTMETMRSDKALRLTSDAMESIVVVTQHITLHEARITAMLEALRIELPFINEIGGGDVYDANAPNETFAQRKQRRCDYFFRVAHAVLERPM
jgi:hypothetical protein